MNQPLIPGLTGQFLHAVQQYPGHFPARIISQHKELYTVLTAEGEASAEPSGKLRYEAQSAADLPAVGDFVMMDRSSSRNGNAIIHHMLPRKSAFIRRAAGTGGGVQVVAANIDTVFICMALNRDFNLRRLERYLSIGWDSRAIPVVVLTKADLCEDVNHLLAQAASVAIGVDLVVASGLSEETAASVRPYLKPDSTTAFIGSSGVGKSTLINALAGGQVMATGATDEVGKGRHTTTRRELILLPGGSCVVDTPGMRELGLEGADISKSFADIDDLVSRCRFSDCTHTGEPGCAVGAAIEAGELDPLRLASYQKLKKEARYETMDSRQIEQEKLSTMFAEFGGMKNARKYLQEQIKRKRR